MGIFIQAKIHANYIQAHIRDYRNRTPTSSGNSNLLISHVFESLMEFGSIILGTGAIFGIVTTDASSRI